VVKRENPFEEEGERERERERKHEKAIWKTFVAHRTQLTLYLPIM
jgi:hypothetical protein